jgi:hypothetical protein
MKERRMVAVIKNGDNERVVYVWVAFGDIIESNFQAVWRLKLMSIN